MMMTAAGILLNISRHGIKREDK